MWNDMSEIKRWEEANHWVEVDYRLCQGMSKCIDVCPMGVYSLSDKKVVAENIDECIMCGACQDVCPAGAIVRHWAWT
jgi:NAD-dependent dihydropyrimidine dehydrogenase PreA subunit